MSAEADRDDDSPTPRQNELTDRRRRSHRFARQSGHRRTEDYWNWDSWKWGTHRVNCYPGGCPFRVYVKDGEVVREELACNYPPFEDPDHRVPDYNPRGCQKGLQHSKAMYGADRVRYPMKRAGERGSGQWQRITGIRPSTRSAGSWPKSSSSTAAEALIDDHSRQRHRSDARRRRGDGAGADGPARRHRASTSTS